MTEQKKELASVGGNTSDLLSSLRKAETKDTEFNNPFIDTLDPYGNPFAGKSPAEMVNYFHELHGSPEDLISLKQKIFQVLGINNESTTESLPEIYQEVLAEIEKLSNKLNTAVNYQEK